MGLARALKRRRWVHQRPPLRAGPSVCPRCASCLEKGSQRICNGQKALQLCFGRVPSGRSRPTVNRALVSRPGAFIIRRYRYISAPAREAPASESIICLFCADPSLLDKQSRNRLKLLPYTDRNLGTIMHNQVHHSLHNSRTSRRPVGKSQRIQGPSAGGAIRQWSETCAQDSSQIGRTYIVGA